MPIKSRKGRDKLRDAFADCNATAALAGSLFLFLTLGIGSHDSWCIDRIETELDAIQ